jgi:hypothetical protein
MRVVRTSKLSTGAADIHYKVPRRTLRACLAENKRSESKLEGKTILSPQQEKELSERIIGLSETGCSITLKLTRMCVFTCCEENNIRNPFVKEKGMAGRAWIEDFQDRNPTIASRKAQNLNPGRAQKLNRFTMNDYFANLKITI